MITLLTLYLVLVAGPHHFKSAVGEDTPRLEFILGGERLSDVLGPSFTFEADLGGKVLQQHRVEGLAAFQESIPDVFVHETDHLYGPDGRAFAVQANGGLPVKYLASDHLGTVRLITNHEGDLLGRHDYYPFGQEVYRENQADDRMHKFTGHERDYSNLTDYMLGRTYLYPKLRFASPDPARDGWNLYAYVGNNPVNYTDPTGKWFIPALAAAWAGAELLMSAADAVEVWDVWTDDTATWGERAFITGLAGLGAVAPGGAFTKADDIVEFAADGSKFAGGRLRDARGRFVSDPANPPSPYTFTDAQRRAEWKRLADDPDSGLTAAERAQIRERGRGPQRVNEYGELETMELSHEPVPLREGGTNVVPRWPADHAAVDPHRHLKKR